MKATLFETALKLSQKAKPFLKWAGGKKQLLGEIERRLPTGLRTGEINTYVEPFVGGGAVYFYLTQRYDGIEHLYLYDINEDLISCYNAIKDNVGAVIAELQILHKAFYAEKTSDSRRQLYLSVRKEFNLEKVSHFSCATAAKLIFLNKTCYNGLYRVNRKGEFNVPFGDYKKPTICDVRNLEKVSQILKKAEIICDDFEKSNKYIDEKTFVYFDPPYRPISTTASFTSYSKEDFDEAGQIRLTRFCKRIHRKGAKFLLSNSDPKDHFFEDHYKGFNIEKVKAIRAINCKASGRGQINELIITNYRL